MSKYNDLLRVWALEQKEHPNMRKGQCLTNALFCVDESVYLTLTNSEIDPFYNDKKVPAALEWLSKKFNSQ